jgi:hypothetical protein
MSWLKRLNLDDINLPWEDEDASYQLRGRAKPKDDSVRFNYEEFKREVQEYVENIANDPENMEFNEFETEDGTQKLQMIEEDHLDLELTYVDRETYLTIPEQKRGVSYTENTKVRLEADERQLIEDFAFHLDNELPYNVTFSGDYDVEINNST